MRAIEFDERQEPPEPPEAWLIGELLKLGAAANSLAAMIIEGVAGDATEIGRSLMRLEHNLFEMWTREDGEEGEEGDA